MKKVLISFVSFITLALTYAFAEAVDIVTVKGTGTGVTEELALKDAYRDAVESAVGMFVDAEQMVKNDELIKDQILTHSNAYIEKRTVLSKDEADGVVKVKIMAAVRRRELTKRIKEVMPSQTVQVGDTLGNIHAVNETVEKRSNDGLALLQNVLKDFHPTRTLVDFKLMSSEPTVVQSKRLKRGGGDGILYPFSTQINFERYQQLVVGQLKPILAQISLIQPRKDSLPIVLNGQVDVGSMRQVLQSPKYSKNSVARTITAPKAKGKRGGDTLPVAKPYNCLLVTGLNASGTIAEVEMYQLDDAALSAFGSWNYHETRPEFRVVFKGENGTALYQETMNSAFGVCYDLRGGRPPSKVIFAPWLIHGHNDRLCVGEWRNVEVPRDVQPSVKSITVEQIK